jgi:hypothetical protein
VADLRCLDRGGRSACSGPVEMRTTPDREDGKHFPRCEAHFEARLAECERTADMRGAARPAWFDEAAVGERWDEDE